MPGDERPLEQMVLARALHLNATIQGIVIGLISGLGIFIATNWLILKGGDAVGPHLGLLGQFFPGYQVSFGGSLIGFAYGLVAGHLIGYVMARIYNWAAQRRERRRLGHS
jgi:hypothetical protein